MRITGAGRKCSKADTNTCWRNYLVEHGEDYSFKLYLFCLQDTPFRLSKATLPRNKMMLIAGLPR